jgi:nitrogen fixation protein NifB
MIPDRSAHPCFNPHAKSKCARVHLPVAPKCNVQCNFCDRKFDCMNESRPGVTSAILTPDQAVEYTRQVLARESRISVAGIAGPGDPFANPIETMRTLQLLRENFPALLLCVATNGLGIFPYIDQLAALQVSHLTLTINAVDPEISKNIYAWVRDGIRIYRGLDAARVLLERQFAALAALKSKGITVKINAIVIPGVNDHHIPAISKTVKQLGADVLNCIPLVPVAGTPFEHCGEPTREQIAAIRQTASDDMPQMYHCTRCRADAVGLLGQDQSADFASCLSACATNAPTHPAQRRAHIAIASWEGILINQHLGEATHLWVYRHTSKGYEFLESRSAPSPGSGGKRWHDLATALADCRVLLCSSCGQTPRAALSSAGVHVLEIEGLITEALHALYTGQSIEPLKRKTPTGCGTELGCAGPGTGCG